MALSFGALANVEAEELATLASPQLVGVPRQLTTLRPVSLLL